MSDEYVKKEEILETTWKCRQCGHTNRGKDVVCANCGAQKDESAYEVDENAAAVTDEGQLADAAAGENWVCTYCNKENRGRKKICQYCGSDNATGGRKRNAGGAPAAAQEPEKKKSNVLVGCLAIAGVVIGLLVLLYWIGSPSRVDAKVVALDWTQELQLQQRTQVAKEEWKDAVPAGAFNSRCEQKQRTTRKVVDHYTTVSKSRRVKYQSGSREECRTVTEDKGNGYASRKEVCKQVPEYDYRDERYTEQEPVYRNEPVYEDFCHFDVYEWPVAKTAVRKGSGTSELAWPDDAEVAAGCTPCDRAKTDGTSTACCQRVGHYRVSFENPKKPEEKPVYEAATPAEFGAFKVGETRRLEIDGDKVKVLKDGE